MIEFNYDIQKEDFVAFQKHWYLSSPNFKNSGVLSGIFVLVVIGLMWYSFYNVIQHFFGKILMSVAFGLIFVIYLIRSKKILLDSFEKRILKMIEGDSAKSVLGPKKAKVTDETLEIIENDEITKIKIKKIHKLIETDEHYFLFRDSISAFIIPKRCTANVVGLSEIFHKINDVREEND